MFYLIAGFLAEQNQLVEPLYKLNRDGKLSNRENRGAEGGQFLEPQLLKSGQLLGDIWLIAWLAAPEYVYLKRQLKERQGLILTK